MDKLKVLQEQDATNDRLKNVGETIKGVVDAQGLKFLKLSEMCAYRKVMENGTNLCKRLHPVSEFAEEAQSIKFCHIRNCPFVKWHTL